MHKQQIANVRARNMLIKLFVSLILPRQEDSFDTVCYVSRRTVSHVNHGTALCAVDFAAVTSANYAGRNGITVIKSSETYGARSRLAQSATATSVLTHRGRRDCADGRRVKSIKRHVMHA